MLCYGRVSYCICFKSDAVELDIIEDDEDAREGQPEMAEPAEADSAPNLTPAKPGKNVFNFFF